MYVYIYIYIYIYTHIHIGPEDQAVLLHRRGLRTATCQLFKLKLGYATLYHIIIGYIM